MKKILLSVLSIVALFVSVQGYSAEQDPKLNAIKARQGEMQLRSFNAGPLFAMAKGKVEYNAADASALANNLKLLLDLNMDNAWPAGSDNVNYPGKTNALPEGWTTYPKIAESSKKYATAVNNLAAEAGKGLDNLRSTIGPLGKSCKSCHDDFQEKQ